MEKLTVDYIATMLAAYCIVYPICFYIWNSAIVACGFPQFIVPSFWGGMGVLIVLREFRGIMKA